VWCTFVNNTSMRMDTATLLTWNEAPRHAHACDTASFHVKRDKDVKRFTHLVTSRVSKEVRQPCSLSRKRSTD
jgi:hypothetical protein